VTEPTAGPRVLARRVAEVPRLVAALAVLALTGIVASRGVPDWEARLFAAINGHGDLLEPILWAPMQLGSLFGPVVVAIGAWVAWRQWRPAVGALVVGVVAWQLAKLVKDAVGRGRPADEVAEIVRRSGTPVDGLGYVSGHSAVAFALATVLSPYLPRTGRWTAYGLAVVVALARIHNGAHFPLDTVGGAALGMSLGFAYHLAVGIPADAPAFR
jgi:membrane-associated phospholipid phosphatase